MKDANDILNEVLKHTSNTHNSLAKNIGLKRSQNLYDIRSGKVKRISFELASLIVKKYNDINIDFLLTGNGELLTTIPAASDISTVSINLERENDLLKQLLTAKDETIQLLKDKLEQKNRSDINVDTRTIQGKLKH